MKRIDPNSEVVKLYNKIFHRGHTQKIDVEGRGSYEVHYLDDTHFTKDLTTRNRHSHIFITSIPYDIVEEDMDTHKLLGVKELVFKTGVEPKHYISLYFDEPTNILVHNYHNSYYIFTTYEKWHTLEYLKENGRIKL